MAPKFAQTPVVESVELNDETNTTVLTADNAAGVRIDAVHVRWAGALLDNAETHRITISLAGFVIAREELDPAVADQDMLSFRFQDWVIPDGETVEAQFTTSESPVPSAGIKVCARGANLG